MTGKQPTHPGLCKALPVHGPDCPALWHGFHPGLANFLCDICSSNFFAWGITGNPINDIEGKTLLLNYGK
jgi:hypothetical protein